MEIRLQEIAKSKMTLQQDFNSFKQVASKPLGHIKEMENSLIGMNEAMESFEKWKNEFGEKLVSDVTELCCDVKQLKTQQKEDTSVICNIQKELRNQTEQLQFLRQQLKLQSKWNEIMENRVDKMEGQSTPVRAIVHKRWNSLPYRLHNITDQKKVSDDKTSVPLPVKKRTAKKRSGSRSLNGKKKLYSSTLDIPSSFDTDLPSYEDIASSYTLPRRRQRLNSFDSLHSKKVFSTSSPAGDDTSSIDVITSGEGGEESGYYGSPAPLVPTTVDHTPRLEDRQTIISRLFKSHKS